MQLPLAKLNFLKLRQQHDPTSTFYFDPVVNWKWTVWVASSRGYFVFLAVSNIACVHHMLTMMCVVDRLRC